MTEISLLNLYTIRVNALQSLKNKHKRRALGRKMYYHLNEHNHLVYTWEAGLGPEYHHIMATHAPDDTITLCASGYAMASMTAHRRLEMICNGAANRRRGTQSIHIWSDKSRHKNKKQHVRVMSTHQNIDYKTSLPYTMGLQVKDACLVNPEICVDYVRRLDSLAAAAAVRRRIAPMVKLTKVLGRMGQLHVEYPAGNVFGWRDKILDKITNIYEPTADDAKYIVYAGMRNLKTWRYPRMSEEEKRAFDKKAVANGLVKLRKELYEQETLYAYIRVEPVTN